MNIALQPDNTIIYTPATYVDLTPAQWLVKLDALKTHCIRLGQSIINSDASEERIYSLFEGAVLTNLAADYANSNNAAQFPDDLSQKVLAEANFINRPNELLSRHLDVLAVKPQDLMPIMVVKQFVDGLISATADIAAKTDVSLGLNLAVAGGSESASGATSWAVKTFIFPLSKWIDNLVSSAAPANLPSAAETMEMYLRGKLGENETQGFMALNGCSWKLWKQVTLARAERPTIDMIVQDAMRHVMGSVPDTTQALKGLAFNDAQLQQVKDYISGQLATRGYAQGIDPEIFIRLFVELPTVSDHLHWLARNADDLEYLSEFHLWAGFSDRQTVLQMFTVLAKRTGFDVAHPAQWAQIQANILNAPLPPILQHRDFYKTFREDLISQGQRQVDSFLHYVSHWLNPAFGEGKEMVWRLRPDKYGPDKSFTKDQLARMLSEKDVSPFFIPRFLEIVNRVISIRYLRTLFNYSDLTLDQVKGILQDEGYSADDSNLLAVAIDRQRKLFLAQQGHAYTPQELQKLWMEGLVPDDFYKQSLANFGLPQDTINQSLDKATQEVGYSQARATIKLIGKQFMAHQIPEQQARQLLAQQILQGTVLDIHINEWKAQRDMEIADNHKKELTQIRAEKVTKIKECYLSNHITLQQATFLLAGAGISQDLIPEYVQLWNFEHLCKVKLPDKSTMVTAAKEGKLDIGTLSAALLSQNYSPADVSFIVADVLLHNQTVTAKQQASLQSALEKTILIQARKTKHLATIKYNLQAALKKADLSVLLSQVSDKVEKAKDKAQVDKLLALGKAQIQQMPPV